MKTKPNQTLKVKKSTSTRKWEEELAVILYGHIPHEPLDEQQTKSFRKLKAFISSAVEQARNEGFLSGYLTGHVYDEKELALQIKLLKPTKAKR